MRAPKYSIEVMQVTGKALYCAYVHYFKNKGPPSQESSWSEARKVSRCSAIT
jgi:hypothetical protein